MPRRLLSHNTLERKIRLIFGLMILLVVIAAFFFPWYQMERIVSDKDVESARAMTQRAFDALHAKTLSEKAPEGFEKLSRIGPAPPRSGADTPYIVSRDTRLAEPEPSPPPVRPDPLVQIGPPRGPHEQKWMQEFDADPNLREAKQDEVREGIYYLRYAYALRARQGCLDCHREKRKDLKAGDLMGAIVISFPIESTRSVIKGNRIVLVAAALATAAISMVVFYAVVRLVIVQPVRHLKRVADRVTEGDVTIRAELQTGDEFEALSRSFNRMLQKLDTSREELRRANVSLDRKLEELAKANVSLFEMNQIKSKFLTTMSHELRTPLNAISGFAELLESAEALRGDPKLLRYVQNIRQAGALLLDIINDLLDMAKIEAGKMEVKLGQVSPLDLAETTMNTIRPMVGSKDLRLELEVAPDCPIMTTDLNKLQQILFNLLSNAVKFTPAGSVRLVVRPLDGETMFFSVIDTGPGLSAEQQKIIFERFSQLDSGHTRQFGGTGLGLPIVRELVDLLGGDVAVQSELGKGAAFNVTLPVVFVREAEKSDEVPVMKVESEPQPKSTTDEQAPPPVTPEDTILVADVEADALKPEDETPGPPPKEA
jgi:signal transduction histidine kinase